MLGLKNVGLVWTEGQNGEEKHVFSDLPGLKPSHPSLEVLLCLWNGQCARCSRTVHGFCGQSSLTEQSLSRCYRDPVPFPSGISFRAEIQPITATWPPQRCPRSKNPEVCDCADPFRTHAHSQTCRSYAALPLMLRGLHRPQQG